MNKKRIIITPSQLYEVMKRMKNKVNEENTVTISAKAKDDSLSSFATAATDSNTLQDIQKAKAVGDVNLKVGGPKESDSQPTQEINVAAGDTVQNAINTQGNSALVQAGGTIKLTGDGFGESKVYKKKAIEEARRSVMKLEGKTYTKKQLMEEFEMEETLENKLENLTVAKVINAYKALGYDPQELATEFDLAGAVIAKFKESSPEQQKRFLEVINS